MKQNHVPIVLIVLFYFSILTSCKDANKEQIEIVNTTKDLKPNKNIEVISTGMNFEMTNEIKSGWTTFK